jgi:hypothetical protein
MAGTQPFDAALTETRERLQSDAQVGQLREEARPTASPPV